MTAAKYLDDNALMELMDEVRDICATANAIRAQKKIRSRHPLSSMSLVSLNGKFSYLAFMPDLVAVIKDECNVKEIKVTSDQGTFIV